MNTWCRSEARVRTAATVTALAFAFLAVLALLAMLGSVGCGKGIDIKTNPVGSVAHYATQATEVIIEVRRGIESAEAVKLIPTDKAATIMKVTRMLGQKMQELAVALNEIDKLPLTDPNRQGKLALAGKILGACNELVFEIVKPIDDAGLRERIQNLLRQVSGLLLDLSLHLQGVPA